MSPVLMHLKCVRGTHYKVGALLILETLRNRPEHRHPRQQDATVGVAPNAAHPLYSLTTIPMKTSTMNIQVLGTGGSKCRHVTAMIERVALASDVEVAS